MAVTAGMIPIIWLVILAVLVVIEIITLGLTTIWFAGGALVALVVSLLGWSCMASDSAVSYSFGGAADIYQTSGCKVYE